MAPTKTTAARARALIELCTLIVLLFLSDLLSREIARAYRVLQLALGRRHGDGGCCGVRGITPNSAISQSARVRIGPRRRSRRGSRRRSTPRSRVRTAPAQTALRRRDPRRARCSLIRPLRHRRRSAHPPCLIPDQICAVNLGFAFQRCPLPETGRMAVREVGERFIRRNRDVDVAPRRSRRPAIE